MRGNRGCGRRGFQPIRILLQRDEKILQPAVRVAKFVGSGPHAEFFQVVAHGREAAGMVFRASAQKFDGVRGRAKRKQVAQRFQAGQNFYGVALILGEIVAEELVEFEAGAEKMIVVHQRVFDAGRRERRGQLRLPDAFGEPCTARARAKMFFDVIRRGA